MPTHSSSSRRRSLMLCGLEEPPKDRAANAFDSCHIADIERDLSRQLWPHAGCQIGVQLDVELQAICAVHAERLIYTPIAACQQLCARRNRERVAVPMKHG